MRRTALLAVLALLVLQGFAWADGGFMPDERTWQQRRESALINEPEQKAVVFFSAGTEQLIISPSYEGDATNFAWVVPVPARPKVEILKGAIFHELARLVMPKPPADRLSKSRLLSPQAAGVKVLERKTVGAYDVSVLAASDGNALMNWLKSNGYHLPDKAVEPIKGYVKDRWTFVACRIKVPGSAKGLKTGTLAPLRLTFKTPRPVYPVRLSAANPKPFIVEVYLVLRSVDIGAKPDRISVAGIPGQRFHPHTKWAATASGYPWNRSRYPTLAGLYDGEMQIYREWFYAEPAECRKDMVWILPRSPR